MIAGNHPQQTVSIALCLALMAAIPGVAAEPAAPLDACNVVWDSPSADSKGSMPIGNGDIGLNVWVEPSGDLCFFISKTDAWDENQHLLKLGKVRVKLVPALVQPGQAFEQKLDLVTGRILIRSGDAEVTVWVDANHPIIQVDARSLSGRPLAATAAFEMWRMEKRPQPGCLGIPGFAWPDTVLVPKPGQIGWYHRNVESPWLASLKLQKADAITATEQDPLLNRTCGAILRGENFVSASPCELKTANPAPALSLRVHVLTRITDTPAAWLDGLETQAERIDKMSVNARRTAHAAWWKEFWNRSWIFVSEAGNAMLTLPVNGHPWRLGMDSAGANRFRGEIAGAQVAGRAFDAAEIAALAAAPRPVAGAAIQDADSALTNACTLAAWIKPAVGETGRILDKCTAGSPDGFTFDAQADMSLRSIVGERTLVIPNCLKADEWQHVAVTLDADGRQTLYLNGKVLRQDRDPDTGLSSSAQRLTRAYALQRWINACGGRGAYPIKFNGSIFTVDHCDAQDNFDADFRRWGGSYWFQNTRLTYWSMLEAGDFDLMRPFFNFYIKALPARKLATKNCYGHDGAFFPETLTIWGNYNDAEYGLNRNDVPDGMVANPYIRRYWQNGLETIVMMLEYHAHTQDSAFRDQTLLPFAREIITFFDQHWKRGADGKILFEPAQSLETWWTARNPLPEIAGLRYIIPRLLDLPFTEADKATWRKTLADLPPVPTHKDAKGALRLAPAESYGNENNYENPELYAVFPYRLYTLATGPELLAIAEAAWKCRRHPENRDWQQNSIQAALLGHAAEAANYLLDSSAPNSTAPGFRFPAIWGPYDWMPDQDHGTVMMSALQRMLVQYEGRRILLLPAWPKDWNVSFKLHAPYETTVEGELCNGKVVSLKVTPKSRTQDVVNMFEK